MAVKEFKVGSYYKYCGHQSSYRHYIHVSRVLSVPEINTNTDSKVQHICVKRFHNLRDPISNTTFDEGLFLLDTWINCDEEFQVLKDIRDTFDS